MALKKIGIDVENGDPVDGKSVTERMVPAIQRFSEENPGVELYLHGHEDKIRTAFRRNFPSQAIVVPASEFYTQGEELTRPKKGTVLNNLVGAVHAQEVEGFFSIGDTSKVAIEAMKMRVKGAKPALVGIFPSMNGDFVCSDIGFQTQTSKQKKYSDAVDDWARTIYSQGLMSSVYMHSKGISKPRWGILSIGTENHKGSDTDKRLEELIHQGVADNNLGEFMEYVGKVEPYDCFEGNVDVALTDGYKGNLFLKTAEASFGILKMWAKEEIAKLSTLEKLRLAPGKDILVKVKQDIMDRANPDKYSGALILGYEGIVVKGHGACSSDGIYYGISNLAGCTSEDSGKKLSEIVGKYMPK